MSLILAFYPFGGSWHRSQGDNSMHQFRACRKTWSSREDSEFINTHKWSLMLNGSYHSETDKKEIWVGNPVDRRYLENVWKKMTLQTAWRKNSDKVRETGQSDVTSELLRKNWEEMCSVKICCCLVFPNVVHDKVLFLSEGTDNYIKPIRGPRCNKKCQCLTPSCWSLALSHITGSLARSC